MEDSFKALMAAAEVAFLTEVRDRAATTAVSPQPKHTSDEAPSPVTTVPTQTEAVPAMEKKPEAGETAPPALARNVGATPMQIEAKYVYTVIVVLLLSVLANVVLTTWRWLQ